MLSYTTMKDYFLYSYKVLILNFLVIMNNFIGKEAIDFSANAVMPNNDILNFNFKSYINGFKCILFFYPLNFTFVCPSEIIAFSNKIAEFQKRNTKVVGVSVDSHFCHLAWKKTSRDQGGISDINFPLVSDLNKDISKNYHVLINEEGVALRGTFLIDAQFIIRHLVVNDLPLGRNIDESLRMIDSLDYYTTHGEVCPAGWTEGKPAIKTTSEGIAKYLKENSDKI